MPHIRQINSPECKAVPAAGHRLANTAAIHRSSVVQWVDELPIDMKASLGAPRAAKALPSGGKTAGQPPRLCT